MSIYGINGVRFVGYDERDGDCAKAASPGDTVCRGLTKGEFVGVFEGKALIRLPGAKGYLRQMEVGDWVVK